MTKVLKPLEELQREARERYDLINHYCKGPITKYLFGEGDHSNSSPEYKEIYDAALSLARRMHEILN